LSDPTETIRREMTTQINAEPGSREHLEQEHGQVWDTKELCRDFEVVGFGAPFVMARRISDGAMGSLKFQHDPRLYFSWMPD